MKVNSMNLSPAAQAYLEDHQKSLLTELGEVVPLDQIFDDIVKCQASLKAVLGIEAALFEDAIEVLAMKGNEHFVAEWTKTVVDATVFWAVGAPTKSVVSVASYADALRARASVVEEQARSF